VSVFPRPGSPILHVRMVLRVNIIPIYRRSVVAAAPAAAVVNECSDTAVFARTHRLLWGELLPLAAALKTVADVDITKCHHRYRSRDRRRSTARDAVIRGEEAVYALTATCSTAVKPRPVHRSMIWTVIIWNPHEISIQCSEFLSHSPFILMCVAVKQ